MGEQFLSFQSFSDIELAKHLSEKLSENKIEHELEKATHILDKNIVGTSSSPDYSIKIRPVDFSRAHQALEDYYKSQIDNIEPDYYLFDFTTEELQEIIAKPDEWNPLDYQLSQKILSNRGFDIDTQKIQFLKEQRTKELAIPEKSGLSFIAAGYILCFSGLLAVIAIFIRGAINYLPSGLLLSVFFGHHLSIYKKILPDGQTVFGFNDSDRRHGRIIFYCSLLFLIFSAIGWMYTYSKQ